MSEKQTLDELCKLWKQKRLAEKNRQLTDSEQEKRVAPLWVAMSQRSTVENNIRLSLGLKIK